MSITDIIKPIKLLSGSHSDIGKTGSGCFMNVIAYLNGEAQITDQSPCVCFTVREIAIKLNDALKDSERGRMIPFIERAMGSATDDKSIILMRVNLLVDFAKSNCALAKQSAKYAAESAESAAKYAKYAKYAEYAEYAESQRLLRVDLMFDFLDKALPKQVQYDQCIIDRAKQLCEVAA